MDINTIIAKLELMVNSDSPNATKELPTLVLELAKYVKALTSTKLYVRPAGTIYGSNNGTDYENAWSGFTNIDWTKVQGNILVICGTHLESLKVESSDVEIIGNAIEESGKIDGENMRNIGVLIPSKNDIVISDLEITRALVSNLSIEGSSLNFISNNIIVSFSNNQGIQHLDSVSAIHNNPTCTNNTDDGISAHDSAIFVVNKGTIVNNSEGIAHVGKTQCTLNGPITFNNNSTSDWTCRSENNNLANAVDFLGDIYVDSPTVTEGVSCVINNCITFNDINVLNGHTVEINSSIVTNILYGRGGGIVNVNSSNINDFNLNGIDRELNLVDTFVRKGILSNVVKGTLTANRCVFDGVNQTKHMIDGVSGSNLSLIYTSFINIPTAKYAVVSRVGIVSFKCDNNTFVGLNNVGKALFIKGTQTANNCIFVNLDKVDNAEGMTYNNCCFYNNASSPNGIVNNSQTNNPNLLNPTAFDFSLGTGSSCIRTGKTLTSNNIISMVNWGNQIEPPVIVTSKQPALWYIGANTD